eukprot:scaffold292367_cov14-Tisochrysis_lutea.AAC.1
MSGCLAFKSGSSPMIVFHQLASGLSKSVNQVGSFSVKWILAAISQTAIICRLQDWWSMVSLLTHKGGVMYLRFVEGIAPNV